jgi:selenocysteine lyase/cysteine desulfurase
MEADSGREHGPGIPGESAEITAEELARLRAETAGAERQIFLNNAGASLPPRRVVERVVDHLLLEEQIGGYEAADLAALEHARVYELVAELLGARPDEIALTESATRAWQMAFYSFDFRPGDRILTAENEYASNYLSMLQQARRGGAEIVVVPSEPGGVLDLEALERTLAGGRIRLLALTHVATNCGLVQPARQAGELARRHGVPFLLDACQSAGQMQLDVSALGCDMLSATGRKYLRGPRGTGFLYVRRGLLRRLEPPVIDMDSARWTAADRYQLAPDGKRFEQWESNFAARLGLGAAVEYALNLGLGRVERRVTELAWFLRRGLERIPGVTVWEKRGPQSGIVAFTHAAMPPALLVEWLRRQGVAVRLSPAEATRLDMEARGLEAVVRASVHYYNTHEEIERFCELLSEAARP